jgi:2-haloalkanoic acid dehalogenase type II
MSSVDPTSLRALTFDCYGTLVDWEAGIRDYVAPRLARSRAQPRVTPEEWVSRWERIQFQMLRPWRPYREILARSYEATMQYFGLEAFVDDGPGLARSVEEWRPFPDTTRALRRLGRRYRLAIVSNIDRDLLAATVGQLQAPLSLLVTAEDARAYKPDPRPLALALERLAEAPAAVLHAGFGWKYDLAPARALGMRTAFIDRSGGAAAPTFDGAPPDLAASSLDALADALGA